MEVGFDPSPSGPPIQLRTPWPSATMTVGSRISMVLRKCRAQLLRISRLEAPFPAFRSSPELCVKVRGSSSMLLLGCLGDLLRFEKREIQVATFAPGRSSP